MNHSSEKTGSLQAKVLIGATLVKKIFHQRQVLLWGETGKSSELFLTDLFVICIVLGRQITDNWGKERLMKVFSIFLIKLRQMLRFLKLHVAQVTVLL